MSHTNTEMRLSHTLQYISCEVNASESTANNLWIKKTKKNRIPEQPEFIYSFLFRFNQLFFQFFHFICFSERRGKVFR